jgi:hypothetical protein
MRLPPDVVALLEPPTRRYVPLTDHHLARLSELAARDHRKFTSASKHPEYRDRRLLAALVRGGAQRYLDDLHNVSEPYRIDNFELWTFYAPIPGVAFTAHERMRPVHFGPFSDEDQHFAAGSWLTERERELANVVLQGPPVRFRTSTLHVQPDASFATVVQALKATMRVAATQDTERPAPWYIAQKPIVLIDPEEHRGEVIWTPAAPSERPHLDLGPTG